MITSSANPRIKQIRKLRERKERQQSGLFYAEGLRIVIEAVSENASIKALVFSPELLTSEMGIKIISDQSQRGIEILEVSRDVFKTLALKDDPQGIGAVIEQTWLPIDKIDLRPGEFWVALDAVADPGNLGTILRTNDSVGGKGVILLGNTTDPYDPTSMRASMGAIFSQKLVRADFEQFAAWKQVSGIAVIGASGAARCDYHHTQYPSEFVLLMGSERQGLLENALALCDQVVSIPMVGRSDSLNLAVANAILLYEIYNQHRDQKQE
ncbi:MAG TPA: RNA methyltransferase [Anaerolineaceae bacterium]|nr:RNA methyltransferase [Anaerolineaceae bacterium]